MQILFGMKISYERLMYTCSALLFATILLGIVVVFQHIAIVGYQSLLEGYQAQRPVIAPHPNTFTG